MLLIVLLECFNKFSACTLKYFTIQRIMLEQQSSCGNITILALTLNKKTTYNVILAKQTTA